MFTLTRQEEQVLLFLAAITLIGLGINFACKTNVRVEKFIKVDARLTKIDLNKASLIDLERLPGVTPKLAKKIIDFHQAQGRFSNIEELKEIKGIGDYRYERLKDLFFVE